MRYSILFLAILLPLQLFAFKFSPMSQTLEMSQGQLSVQFFVENEATQPIAIQLSSATRSMEENGEEVNSKAEDEIEIFPEQLILEPHQKRSIKVSYKGTKDIKIEKAYRIIAEQLPVELSEKKSKASSIKVLLRYVAALYVDPGKTESQIVYQESKIKDKKIYVVVENKGTRHQVLTNLRIQVVQKKKEIIEKQFLKGMNGENILAQSKRVFEIESSPQLEKVLNSKSVELKFEKE